MSDQGQSDSAPWRDFDLSAPTPEHALFERSLREFTEREVEPQATEFNRAERFNLELFRKAGAQGFLGVTLPERPRALDDAFARLKPPAEADLTSPFRVRYSDLDVNRHVNNVRYAEWAVESVPEETLYTCRLRSLELQFHAEAVYGDTVLVHTRQAPSDTLETFTHRLVRQHDAHLVAIARTSWERR